MYIVDFYIGKTGNRNDEKDSLFLLWYKKQRSSYTWSSKIIPTFCPLLFTEQREGHLEC